MSTAKSSKKPQSMSAFAWIGLCIFGLIMLGFSLLGGYANFETWTEGKEGLQYFTFGALGIGFEGLGFLLLPIAILIWRANRGVIGFSWAAILTATWLLISGINAESSFEYWYSNSEAVKTQKANEATQAQIKSSAAQTQKDLALNDIERVQNQLAGIKTQKIAATLRAEAAKFDAVRYRTKVSKLLAEADEADRRDKLENELAELKATLTSANAVLSSTVSLQSGGSGAGVAKTETSDKSLLQVYKENKFGIVTALMEFLKAIGMTVLLMAAGSNKPAHTREVIYTEEKGAKTKQSPVEASSDDSTVIHFTDKTGRKQVATL